MLQGIKFWELISKKTQDKIIFYEEKKDIKFSFNGKLNLNKSIPNLYLCTLYWNIIKVCHQK